MWFEITTWVQAPFFNVNLMIWTLSFSGFLLFFLGIPRSTGVLKKFWGVILMMGLVFWGFILDSFGSHPLEVGPHSLILLTLGLFFPTYLSLIQKRFTKQLGGLAPGLALLFLVLTLIFFAERLLVFFVLFELSAFPIIYLIFMGGRRKNKGEASLFLFIFTGLRAFFLFTFIRVMITSNQGDLSWILSEASAPAFPLGGGANSVLEVSYVFLVISAFLVKMPVFFLHMWLPKAHVEAPVYGSMILARVILKLGGYGIWIMRRLTWNRPCFLVFITLGVYGAAVAAFSCFGQKDVKVIIALSRVNHMTFILLGLIRLQSQSLRGVLFLILGHGVISSLIFFLRIKPYSNFSSRRALGSILPGTPFFLSLIWIRIIFINRGFPPFLNFLGEINILKQFSENPLIIIMGGLNFLAVGLYGVLMLSLLASRKALKPSFSTPRLMSNHVLILGTWLHLILLLVLTFFPRIWA